MAGGSILAGLFVPGVMRTLRRLFARNRSGVPADRIRATGSEWSRVPVSSSTAVRESCRIASNLCDERRYAEALIVLNGASAFAPGDSEIVYAKGCTLLAWGRYWEAERCFTSLAGRRCERSTLFTRLGWTKLALGDAERAEELMRRAVLLTPNDWEAQFGLGDVLRNRDPRAAKNAFAAALALSPKNIHCLINLSACEVANGNFSAAEDYARHALSISRTSAPAWTNLGVALLRQDRLVEAGESFAHGAKLTTGLPDTGDDDLNVGTVLQYLGRTSDAIKYFEQRLPRRPNAAASGHYALALLTAGRFTEGWVQYEFRWLDEALKPQRARYGVPPWCGQDITRKTVLLRCEQGVGDVLQFIRYASLVKALGATVWLELRPGIRKLAREFRGIDRLFDSTESIQDFDYYADLLSLPRVFHTTLSSIPSDVPYLQAPVDSRAQWRGRFEHSGAGRVNVGLVWAGDPNHVRDRHRSIAVASLAPLIGVRGVRWYSLQKGIAVGELANAALGQGIIDLAPDLCDYADTAAAIEQLDLVVTVDTSVAHLAGALGKPVWLMLPFVADWRWMEERRDSPWYPTMRLFRQRAPGDWADVIERVKVALASWLRVSAAERKEPTLEHRRRPLADELSFVDDRAPISNIPKACRSRVGMIQYIAGLQPLAASLEYYGEFLQAHTDTLTHFLAPDAVVLEIGASIGMSTIALASLVAPRGYVLACENSSVLRRILRQNLIANDVRCAGMIENIIVGSTHVASDAPKREAGILDGVGYSVDDLQLEQLDLLKVSDPSLVQDALDGGGTTLWRHRPILFLSLQSRGELTERAALASDLGYRCWSIESPLFNRRNFNRREDDIFFGKTSLAILGIPEERDSGIIPVTQSGITEI